MTVRNDVWTELRYTGKQVLPELDGIADELEAVSWWDVQAVRCGPDQHQELVTGRGAVVVLDLHRPDALLRAIGALGGQVAHVADVLLTADGRLRDGVADRPVESVLVFLAVDVKAAGADSGLSLRSADLVRRRLAGLDSLIASYPSPYTDDPEDPLFLRGVPDAVRVAWTARGLTHVGSGVWTLRASENLV